MRRAQRAVLGGHRIVVDSLSARHAGRILKPIGDGLLELRGSGSNESNKPPENEATQNGKAAAP
jgi:class 3 adenylate cyclase